MAEANDPLGSWTATFGLGAVGVTALTIAAFCVAGVISKTPLPQPRTEVMLLPGSAAGILWCAGMLLTTIAVDRGGERSFCA